MFMQFKKDEKWQLLPVFGDSFPAERHSLKK